VLYQFAVQIDDWEQLGQPFQREFIGEVVRRLVNANVVWLQLGDRWKRTPSIYESGVRFEREADGALNFWHSIAAILKLRRSHCVGLSAWRCAELAVRYGEEALIDVSVSEEERPIVGRQQQFHVCVRRASGALEDVARNLGMP
jgi:hypothetical protein